MDQFARAVDGIAGGLWRARRVDVSGNVSLYNETDGRSILPTPTVAAVGLVTSRDDVVTAISSAAWATPCCCSARAASSGVRALGGSEWLVGALGKLGGEAPLIELAAEVALQKPRARAGARAPPGERFARAWLTEVSRPRWPKCCTAGRRTSGRASSSPATAASVDALSRLFGEAPSRGWW